MSQLKLTQQQQQRYNNAMDNAPIDTIISILCNGLADVTIDDTDVIDVTNIDRGELDLF